MDRTEGKLEAICISPCAGAPMQQVFEAIAIEGEGLQGDRYATGEGSWNLGRIGKRQVTLINSTFFTDSEFAFIESRRNLLTSGVELMHWLAKNSLSARSPCAE